jgi:hypothetical protein
MGMTDEDRRRLKGNGGGGIETLGASLMEPLAVRPSEAGRLIGKSRSSIYRMIRRGELDALKSGDCTLVTVPSLRRHIASAPRLESIAA